MGFLGVAYPAGTRGGEDGFLGSGGERTNRVARGDCAERLARESFIGCEHEACFTHGIGVDCPCEAIHVCSTRGEPLGSGEELCDEITGLGFCDRVCRRNASANLWGDGRYEDFLFFWYES